MPNFRRAFRPGGTFFFTIVTQDRRPILIQPSHLDALRHAVAHVRQTRPFEIVAAVILPDHIHWIWELPSGDADFSNRIRLIKTEFTRRLLEEKRTNLPNGKFWQRGFWEHTIRDQTDLSNHINYIHYNPVRHGHAKCPHLWQPSSFHRFVERDILPSNWRCSCEDPMRKIEVLPDFDAGEPSL